MRRTTPKAKEAQISSSLLIGDALIIATVTAIGYLITYDVNVSYLGYFGLPMGLVYTPANEVITTTAIILGAAFICSFLAKAFYRILSSRRRGKAAPALMLWNVFLAYAIPFFIVQAIFLREISLVLIGWYVVGSLFILVEAIVLDKYSKHRIEKRPQKIERIFLTTHIDEFLQNNRRRGEIAIVMFVVLVLAFYLASSIGTSLAQFRKNFYVVNGSNTPLVVISQSGNMLISEPIDSGKQLQNQVYLINESTLVDKGLYLTLEGIGPIKPQPQQRSLLETILPQNIYTWQDNGLIGF